MSQALSIRQAVPADAQAMAKVHVESWRETYRGLMSDALLDDPAMLDWREKFWTEVLTESRYAKGRSAVALHQGQVIGIAMSRPESIEANSSRHLYVLYVRAEFHGTGAGSLLLNTVLDKEAAASLWVADPNPRAQAFYLKHGFECDGGSRVEDNVRSIHMARGSKNSGA